MTLRFTEHPSDPSLVVLFLTMLLTACISTSLKGNICLLTAHCSRSFGQHRSTSSFSDPKVKHGKFAILLLQKKQHGSRSVHIGSVEGADGVWNTQNKADKRDIEEPIVVELFTSQVVSLFPSDQSLEVIWSSVFKIGQSLYREASGMDPFRPDQKTPLQKFFLAGSYMKQDYIVAWRVLHYQAAAIAGKKKNFDITNANSPSTLRPRTTRSQEACDAPSMPLQVDQ